MANVGHHVAAASGQDAVAKHPFTPKTFQEQQQICSVIVSLQCHSRSLHCRWHPPSLPLLLLLLLNWVRATPFRATPFHELLELEPSHWPACCQHVAATPVDHSARHTALSCHQVSTCSPSPIAAALPLLNQLLMVVGVHKKGTLDAMAGSLAVTATYGVCVASTPCHHAAAAADESPDTALPLPSTCYSCCRPCCSHPY
jgi:hypothetical protein